MKNFLFIFVAIIIAGTFLFVAYPDKFFNATKISSEFYQNKINEEDKKALKAVITKIKNFIYFNAEKYNPAGDVLPDEIDDNVKEEIKNRVN